MTIRRLWRLWGLTVLLVAVPILLWGGAGAPRGAGLGAVDLTAEVPGLPAAGIAAADRAELAHTRLWGTSAAPAGGTDAADALAAKPQPGWSLAGVYMKDAKRRVVLRYAQDVQPPRLLDVGDVLPDGARVTAIERDRVQVQAPGDAGATHWASVNRTADAKQ